MNDQRKNASNNNKMIFAPAQAKALAYACNWLLRHKRKVLDLSSEAVLVGAMAVIEAQEDNEHVVIMMRDPRDATFLSHVVRHVQGATELNDRAELWDVAGVENADKCIGDELQDVLNGMATLIEFQDTNPNPAGLR